MVPSWVDQLQPQLLMEQFDTLPIQCRHIEHMHEEGNKYFFFIKFHLWELRLFFRYKLWYIALSGVINFVLYSSFSLTLTVRGYLISIDYWLFSFEHVYEILVLITWCNQRKLRRACASVQPHLNLHRLHKQYKDIKVEAKLYASSTHRLMRAHYFLRWHCVRVPGAIVPDVDPKFVPMIY